jgi:hypothetical protein
MHDGFGYSYYYDKLYDPLSYRIYIFGIPGLLVVGYCTDKLRKVGKEKSNG